MVASTSGSSSGLAGWAPTAGMAFRYLLAARLCSVFFMHISDCDETFNYWEPFHYLLYGRGFQTWEYSPVYALRSYGYVLLHVFPMQLTFKTHKNNKLMIFFLTRVVLGALCTFTEFYFYKAVLHKFGPRVAKWMLLFLVCGCGMFVASSAFLPSSFSMYFTMLALGAWFMESNGLAVFAIAVSAIVGWPFSAALGIPIALDIIFSRKQLMYFMLWSFLSLLLTAVPLVVIDSLYYGRLVSAPLNIIMYNIFGQGGPNLYGVEPWTFYFMNGFLNFNVVFLLALFAVGLVETQVFFEASVKSTGKSLFQKLSNFLSLYIGKGGSSVPSRAKRAAVQSMCIWVLVFFTRPHKEERFIFPIFPLFCLNAAIAVCSLPDVTQVVLTHLRAPRDLKSTVRGILQWFPSLTGLVYVLLSASRIIALYKGYHAPIDVYTYLSSEKLLTVVQPIYDDINVCVGKEWYRFPGSLYLPSPKWHLRFVRSEFKGQLPKPYSEQPNGTWVVPEDMNSMNREEPSRYFNLEDCHFMVDLVTGDSSSLEPCYTCDHDNWREVVKYPFLDTSRSHKFFRAFYMPYLSASHTVYSDYVLLLHKPKFKEIVKKLSPEHDTSFI